MAKKLAQTANPDLLWHMGGETWSCGKYLMDLLCNDDAQSHHTMMMFEYL